ncbi:MAG: hypothetical protein FVQ79_05020 [Planctomycetes bacterium]|nr:hypothetical protein [Planctomycetota bacterium]
MKYIKRIALALAVIVTANILLWPPKSMLIDHTEKPEKGSQRREFENNLVQSKPQIVLLGNSMLTEGIESGLLSSLTQTRTARFSRGGSSSAWWYLVLKNVIAKSSHKPSIIAIFFRDEYLTRPDHRVTDKFKLIVNDMANDEEPLLDRLAYLESMNYPSYLLNKYSPLYQKRDGLKKSVDSFIKHKLTASVMGVEPGKVDDAIKDVFDNNNLNRGLMTKNQFIVESNTNADDFDFDKVIDKSFLPHMIKIADKKNIELVFVRVKKRRDLKPDSEPARLKSYITDLKSYMEKNNVTMLDFTHDSRLKLGHYAGGDHLNRKTGIILFTKLFAQAMRPIIEENAKYDQSPIAAQK